LRQLVSLILKLANESSILHGKMECSRDLAQITATPWLLEMKRFWLVIRKADVVGYLLLSRNFPSLSR